MDDPVVLDVWVPWPIKDSGITLSGRDGRLPLLKEFDSPFVYDVPLSPLVILASE